MISIICGLWILSKLLKSMTKRVSREVIMIMLSYIIGISLTFFGISNQHEVNLQKFESCFFYVYKQNDPHCHLRHQQYKALNGTSNSTEDSFTEPLTCHIISWYIWYTCNRQDWILIWSPEILLDNDDLNERKLY